MSPSRHDPPLFKTLEIDVDELRSFPDLAHDVCTGRFDVTIVRGVFSTTVMETVRGRLERGDHGLVITPQHRPDPALEPTKIYGDGITPNELDHLGPPLERYHAAALNFQENCRRLFAGLPDYEQRLGEVFRLLSSGRAAEVPRDKDGRMYSPSTIRRLPTGREMNMHVGNSFLATPAYAYLSSVLAPLDQLSFFIPISLPEGGGEIEVYELSWQDPRTPLTAEGHVSGAAVQERFRFESFRPEAGQMFLFNGGRYYHRVNHVRGPLPRWTVGGFVSFAKDERVLYYWG